MIKKFLEIGEIVGTHGIKGEIKITPWCDDAKFLAKFKTLYFDNGNKSVKVTTARVHKNIVLAKFDGIEKIEDGDKLRGKVLYIDRKDAKLEKGAYFIQDLLGIDVIDVDSNKCYGKITDIFKTGSNDVYEVTNQSGEKYYLPAIDDVIIEKNPELEYVKIRAMEGIFEDAN